MILDYTTIVFKKGPTTGQTCYKLFYSLVTNVIDNLMYEDGITQSYILDGIPCEYFMCTTWQEILDYCTAHNLTIDESQNYWQNLDTSH